MLIRRQMVPFVFTALVLVAHAQNASIAVQCAKEARQVSSEELMRMVVSTTPVFPPSMERLSIYGTVTLRVCVNRKGKVLSAAVIDGHPMARQAVLESVQKWQFKPYRLNGRLKDVVADLKVDYDFRSPEGGNGHQQRVRLWNVVAYRSHSGRVTASSEVSKANIPQRDESATIQTV